MLLSHGEAEEAENGGDGDDGGDGGDGTQGTERDRTAVVFYKVCLSLPKSKKTQTKKKTRSKSFE